jgi:hypothetical protein
LRRVDGQLERALGKRQEQRERAAAAERRADVDLAAQEPCDLTRDRQSEPGAAVLAGGRPVRLLERLEDRAELVVRNADAGVGDGEGDHALGRPKRLRVESRLFGRGPERQDDAAGVGELERVREQVLEDLLEPLVVGDDRHRKLGVDLDLEIEPVLLGDGAECPLGVLADVRERDRREVELHPPGFDLRQVEDVVDQRQQVVARGVDRLRELDLARRQHSILVLRQQP